MLLDTNIVLDVLLARKPFAQPAEKIFSLVEQSQVEGYLCATTMTTVDYLLNRSLPSKQSRRVLWNLIKLFAIAPVNRPVIEEALHSKIKDFEDAVIEQAGRLAGVEVIITRNSKDFKNSTLKIFDPEEFLIQIGR